MVRKYASSVLLGLAAVGLAFGLAKFSTSALDSRAEATPFSVNDPVDDTAPVISDIGVYSIAPTSASVSWTTNESATTLVKYGKTTNYGTQTEEDTAKSTSHRVALTGLLPNTTYHFVALSADAAGNSAVSGDGTFTTLKKDDPISYGTCLVIAIQKRDTAIRGAWDTFATSVSNAFQTRMEALSSAYYLTTKKQRSDAVKAAWKAFKTSRKTARKAYNNVRYNSWTTFRTERKACKAPTDSYGSGIDMEPVHAD